MGEAGAVFSIMFLAVTLGILTRTPGQIAAVWPANAVLLGLMVRYPSLSAAPCWGAAAAAHVLAETMAGGALPASLLAAGANLCGVATGLAIFGRLPLWARRLRRPAAILILLLAALACAAATALLVTLASPLAPDASQPLLRFMRELTSQIAILPVILAAPTGRARRRAADRPFPALSDALPALAVGASCLAAMKLGGPGAIVFPMPALLWCAMTYRVFATSTFTLLFTVWAVLGMPPSLPLSAEASPRLAILSIQIAVTLLALVPIGIASVMAARDEQMELLRHRSAHDALTGLLNRQAFHEAAEARLAGGSGPVALLMIDLDHFKAINDGHGHAAGDRVLQAFAGIARQSLRKRDIIGRLGGEEFAVLLPGCRPVDARGIAERLRDRLVRTPIPIEDDREIAVTASIGLVVDLRPGAEVAPLLLQADQALYRAKAAGRNRVEE